MGPDDWQRLGVYDPAAPDAADDLKVLEYVDSLGPTEEELLEVRDGKRSIGDLALDLALRPPGELLTFEEAVERSGLEADEVARFIRALGFPDPRYSDPRIPERYAEHLAVVVKGGKELLGTETTLAVARVLGSTSYRLAQAVIDALRANFEVPQHQKGVPYSEVVDKYAGLTKSMLPVFLEAFESTFRDHLIQIASGAWSFDEEEGMPRRDLLVGFVDMTGYTRMSRAISSAGLANLVTRFEEEVADIVSKHDGHVVKLIGDGAMFVCSDSMAGCLAALEMVEHFESDESLPPVHIGLAAGPLITLNGDYFGDSVNIAARLLGLAPASTVLVQGSVADAAGEDFRFVPVTDPRLEGMNLLEPILELART